MRSFLTPWWLQEEKCVYWKVSVDLKCVRMSRIPWLWNLLSKYWLDIETSFCFFPAPWARQLSHKVNKFAPSLTAIHTQSGIKWNLKPQMQVTPLPIFGAKCKWKPIKRDKSTSRDFVARGRLLRGQTRLAPLAKRSTCSKSRICWITWSRTGWSGQRFHSAGALEFHRIQLLLLRSFTRFRAKL